MMSTDNGNGVYGIYGIKMLGEALKVNSTLTNLDLTCIKNKLYCLCFSHQTMKRNKMIRQLYDFRRRHNNN